MTQKYQILKVNKSIFPGFINNTDLNKKSNTSSKAKSKAKQDKTKKLEAFDSSYFCGKSHFEDDSTQNYLVFLPSCEYFKKIGNSDQVSFYI